jgi:hypothetical protein
MGARLRLFLLMFLVGSLSLSGAISVFCQDGSEGTGATVSEKNLAMMPCKYVEKSIVTEAQFMDVSTTLLDDIYHDADTKFSSKEYLNFRTVGNGMHHYFIKQSKADILPTLKVGDMIRISGKVTSCADEHAWVDVDSVVKISDE